MSFLPIFLNLEGKKIVVVGGGRAAEIKLKKLLDFSCTPIVIAAEMGAEIEAWQKRGQLEARKRSFQEEDLEDAFLVICACDQATNDKIAGLARQRKILVCRTDAGNKGDFIFPAHKKEGDITIAVSTSGKYPLLAKAICEAAPCPKENVLEALEEKRRFVIHTVLDQEKRREILKNACYEMSGEAMPCKREEKIREKKKQERRESKREEKAREKGKQERRKSKREGKAIEKKKQ